MACAAQRARSGLAARGQRTSSAVGMLTPLSFQPSGVREGPLPEPWLRTAKNSEATGATSCPPEGLRGHRWRDQYWPDHQDIVGAGRGDLQAALGVRVPAHVREI